MCLEKTCKGGREIKHLERREIRTGGGGGKRQKVWIGETKSFMIIHLDIQQRERKCKTRKEEEEK